MSAPRFARSRGYGALRPVAVALLLCLALARLAQAAKQKNLQIITESKPDSCDEMAEIGDEVFVHYTGYLDSGAVFDTSRQANRGPLPFVLGQGQVIKGWEQGIIGMCVGEKRKLVIPPHLAYGSQGHSPVIPPDATLTFSTELVSVKKKGSEEILFRVLRFLAIPAAVVCAVYFLYSRVKKEPGHKKHPAAAKEARRAAAGGAKKKAN